MNGAYPIEFEQESANRRYECDESNLLAAAIAILDFRSNRIHQCDSRQTARPFAHVPHLPRNLRILSSRIT
jgi:hypothetical protein